MKKDDARDQREDEIKRAERYFEEFQRCLDVVRKQREKENSGSYELFSNLEEWEDKPINEVFIDDVLEYAKSQKNGDSIWETLNKVYNSTDVAEIDKLPERQKDIARKKFEELRQLDDRSQRMVDAGHTKEYTDEILKLTYDMSKDGLREAVRFDISSIAREFPKKALRVRNSDKVDRQAIIRGIGWFNSSNGITKNLGGKEFHSFTEYVASKTSLEAFNKIENVNSEQGGNSYTSDPIKRKFAVLKSMGYDLQDYDTWDQMKARLTADGFYVQQNMQWGDFERQFDYLKHHQDIFPQYCEGQKVFDAALQIVLENTKIPGNDRENHSMILFRTEDSKVAPNLDGENINGKFSPKLKGKFFTGVCESHSHVNACYVRGKYLTVIRVPYSRIHALWFIEKGKMTPQGYVKVDDFQFWAHHQDEFDACTHGLHVVGVGVVTRLKDPCKKAVEILKQYEGAKEK